MPNGQKNAKYVSPVVEVVSVAGMSSLKSLGTHAYPTSYGQKAVN